MTVAALLLAAVIQSGTLGGFPNPPAQGHGTKVATGKRPARAAETQKRSAAPAPSSGSSASASASASASSGDSGGSASDDSGGGKTVGADGKNYKSKTYNFGAMDVEGKLKTPQLLYFLNRVKLELDMSAPDTRSFMKELEKSADDKNL
jgi:hypothetical protein